MYSNFFDSHTHSDNSPDGAHSITFMCENAVNKGLTGMAVTDHCEVNAYRQDKYDIRIRQSLFEANIAKAAFKHRLLITSGVELGQPMQDVETAEKIISAFNFDFILGSVHNIANEQDFYYIDYSSGEVDINALLDRYFKEMYAMVLWGGFDVLAHITYPLRYLAAANVNADLGRHSDIIDEILKAAINSGKGIEVNTSGLRQAINDTMPNIQIIKRYRELGGEIITIGSDAHCTEHIGCGVQDTMSLLSGLGFKYFAFYKNRKPRMLNII